MSRSVIQRTADKKRLATNGVTSTEVLAAINTMCDEGRKWTANEGDVMVSSVCLRTADFLQVM